MSTKVCQNCGTAGEEVYNYMDHGMMLCQKCKVTCRRYLIDHFDLPDTEREKVLWSFYNPESKYQFLIGHQRGRITATFHFRLIVKDGGLQIRVAHRCRCGARIRADYRQLCPKCRKSAEKRCHRCTEYFVSSSEELGESFDCCKRHYDCFSDPYCTGFMQRTHAISHTCAGCGENPDNTYYHDCEFCGVRLKGSLREVCNRKADHHFHHLQELLWEQIFAEVEKLRNIHGYHNIKHYLRFHGVPVDILHPALLRCNEIHGTKFPIGEQNESLDYLIDFSGIEVIPSEDTEDLISLLVRTG